MKKYLILCLIGSMSYMQTNISGYSIFDYSNDSINSGFDIKRAYLIYSNDISEDLFFKIRFDVGRTSTDVLTTYLKNAYIDWKCDNGDKFSMGLIGTNSYVVQEKNWGYRFIEKSALDKYGATNTADFGIGYSKTFGQIKANLQLLNGEGYKATNTNNKQALYISIVYGETKLNTNDGMNLGLIINYSPEEDKTSYNHLVGSFVGCSSKNLRFGVEHNEFKEKQYKSTKKISSLYTNYTLSNSWDIFMRHDIHDWKLSDPSYTPGGFNEYDSGEVTILGGVWNPTKGLYISPNMHIDNNVNSYYFTFMFKY